MTTAAEAVAVARVMYDRGDVYRLPPQGFSAPVSIQDLPPYDDGRFTGAGYNGTPGIQHCGVAVARLLYLAGLMPGRDYPDATAMQYAPTLAGYINVDGDPRPGDIAVYDFQPDRVEDHVGLVVDTSGLPATVTVWQCNTTDDGRAYYYDDPTGWIVGYVRPAYSEAAPPLPDGADVETLCARFFRGQGFSDAGVAGALANWHAESKFDPGIVEGGGHDLSAVDDVTVSGIGLAQWSFSRREGLLDFAAARGLAWNDAATQFDWTVAEVQSRADFQALWQRMAAAFDPVEASRDFDSVFEGSGVKGTRFATAAEFYTRVVSGRYWSTPQPSPRVPLGALVVLEVI